MTEKRLIQLLEKYGIQALSMLKDDLATTEGATTASYRFLLDSNRLHIYTIPVPYWVEKTSSEGYTNLVHLEWTDDQNIAGVEISDESMLEKIISHCIDIEKNELSLPAAHDKKLTDTLAKFPT